MSWPRPIRVLGIGSHAGDDALAWAVVRLLQERAWPCDFEFQALEGGQRLLEVLDGRGSLVLIDALAPAGRPGAIRRFDWPDPGIAVLRPGSTHHLRPAEVLELAAALGLLPARVAVWAIEGEAFDPRPGLSPKILAAVPEMVKRISDELEENAGRE
jgi:hydrogenase maturation protease